MSKRKDFAATPYYVLKRGNQPISPTVHFEDPDTRCVCVYGFSDKLFYNQFIKNAAEALTPYPLVKGYLSNQIDEAVAPETQGDHLRLVILDATDPAQRVFLAASMATVLLAQQEKSKQVAIEFELVFDPEKSGYRLKDEPAIDPLLIVK